MDSFLQYVRLNSIFVVRRLAMKNVVTIRIPDEYCGMLENIKLELAATGLEIKDNVLIKAVLLTGIRDINLKIIHGINVFEDERNQNTDD